MHTLSLEMSKIVLNLELESYPTSDSFIFHYKLYSTKVTLAVVFGRSGGRVELALISIPNANPTQGEIF